MTIAKWNGAVIAQSDKTIIVEGNHYFPLDAVNASYLRPTDTTSRCPWKGLATYYSLVVDGETNEDAAWTYVAPSEAAAAIRGHVAFWKGVQVS